MYRGDKKSSTRALAQTNSRHTSSACVQKKVRIYNLARHPVKRPIVFIKPIWIVVLYVSVFFLHGIWTLLMPPQYFLVGIIIPIAAVAFQMYWAFNTRAFARGKDQDVPHGKITLPKIIFFLGLIGYSIMSLVILSGTFGWIQTADNILSGALVGGMIVGNLSAFTLIGMAAFSLEKAEKGDKATALNIIVSFFQIFYFPIGIWFLHPRLNKLDLR